MVAGRSDVIVDYIVRTVSMVDHECMTVELLKDVFAVCVGSTADHMTIQGVAQNLLGTAAALDTLGLIVYQQGAVTILERPFIGGVPFTKSP